MGYFTRVRKFNPNHDPKDGRFTNAAGGGGGSDAGNSNDAKYFAALGEQHPGKTPEQLKEIDRQRSELGPRNYNAKLKPETRSAIDARAKFTVSVREGKGGFQVTGVKQNYTSQKQAEAVASYLRGAGGGAYVRYLMGRGKHVDDFLPEKFQNNTKHKW